MKIKYKILSINHEEHSIEVRYYTDLTTEEMLAIDSNKREDGTPMRCRMDYNINIWKWPSTQEEIEQRIKECAPIDFFNILETETHLHHIEHLVGKEHDFDSSELNPKELTEEDIEEMLKKI